MPKKFSTPNAEGAYGRIESTVDDALNGCNDDEIREVLAQLADKLNTEFGYLETE